MGDFQRGGRGGPRGGRGGQGNDRGGRGGGGGGRGGGQGGGGYQGQGGGGQGYQGQGGDRGGHGYDRGGRGGGRGGGGGGGYQGQGGGGGGYQGQGGERGRGGGGFRGADRGRGGGGFGGDRGRGGGGRGGGGGGGFRGEEQIGMVAQQMGRMNLAPREYIDMAVAKEITTTRPQNVKSKMGSSGTPVNLITNFLPIETKNDWDIFQYRVDFVPDIPDTRIRKSLLAREKAKVGGNCFDGTMMFTVKRLTVTELAVKLPNTEDVIQIKIREVGIMSRTDQRFLQIYNIILNRAMMGLKLTQMGRNYYDSNAAIDVPAHKIQLWPGYVTSIRQHEHKILLNVEIGYKFLRMETMRHLFDQCQQDSTRMMNVACGQIVLTTYNNTTYRIDRIDFETTPMSTFKKGDKEISYMAYYKERYGITIQDPKQPMLVSKAKARQIRGGSPEEFFLVPELCRLTGLTDQMRANNYLMRELAQFTRVDPRGRQQRLNDFSRRMLSSTESVSSLSEFGLQLGPQLVPVRGRVLPSEDVIFRNSKTVNASAKADWTGALQREKVFSARDPLTNWFVLTPSRCREDAENFVNMLQRVSNGLGIQCGKPEFVELQYDRAPDYVRELERVCQSDPQLVMCVVSNDNADRYSAIKKTLSVHRSVLSQVMLAKNVQERNSSKMMSVATKVMIQINAKLGNAPWKVKIPMAGMMVIGFDVCHDTRDRSRSFAAFIASMDQQKSDVYYSAAAAHKNGEELSNSFGQMTLRAVETYVRTHNELPKTILVYRDGVGDGQLEFVINHELKQLRQVLQEQYGEQPVRLAFIVVTKRINARFFKGPDNPQAGTVVDDVVTLPERYDFFLVSQNVNQGTATPTNYNVIYDTLGLSPDRLQLLTQKLCHLYYNWSGTVRVPNVCQYAHKLSLLVGQYFHAEPNAQLGEKLHFL